MKRHHYDFASESDEDDEIKLHKEKKLKIEAKINPVVVMQQPKLKETAILKPRIDLPPMNQMNTIAHKDEGHKIPKVLPHAVTRPPVQVQSNSRSSKVLIPQALATEDSSESDSSSSSSSSSDESATNKIKLQFIPKESREQPEPQPIEINEDDLSEDNYEFIAHSNQLEKKSKFSALTSDKYQMAQIDDSDGNSPEEYEKWKIRELNRLIRNKQESMAYELLIQEVEEFRSLPESERNELFAKKLKQQQEEQLNKTQYTFLQKYYHKGAFYQDLDNEIVRRDYDVATGSDAVDKSELPSVMQVKNFGKKGKSKWTHLRNEDTLKDKEAWGDDDIHDMMAKKQKLDK